MFAYYSRVLESTASLSWGGGAQTNLQVFKCSRFEIQVTPFEVQVPHQEAQVPYKCLPLTRMAKIVIFTLFLRSYINLRTSETAFAEKYGR